jgi:hypothetical protein
MTFDGNIDTAARAVLPAVGHYRIHAGEQLNALTKRRPLHVVAISGLVGSCPIVWTRECPVLNLRRCPPGSLLWVAFCQSGSGQACAGLRHSAQGRSWPKGERRLSAVGMPERTFTSALPNGKTRPLRAIRGHTRRSSGCPGSGYSRPTAGRVDEPLTSTGRAAPSPLSDRRCRSPR